MHKSICIIYKSSYKEVVESLKKKAFALFNTITELEIGDERFLDEAGMAKILASDAVIVLSDVRLEMLKTLGIPVMFYSDSSKGYFYKHKDRGIIIREIDKGVEEVCDAFFTKLKEVMISYKGIFITFEGIDFSGKSTQATMLVDYYKKKGKGAIYTKEPGSTDIGRELKSIFMKRFSEMNGITETMLLLADRSHHLFSKGGIVEELKNNKIVVCDRYSDSTLVYQGFRKRVPLSVLVSLNRLVTNNIMPDITFFIDITKDTAVKRMNTGKPDPIDEDMIYFFESIRKGYLELAKIFPSRIKIIDGEKSVNEIHRDIISHLSSLEL